jgi:hypothetical protein
MLAHWLLLFVYRTGAAIKHMANEGFTERRGARPQHSKNVSRVAIIVTDGRSQDNVTIPAHGKTSNRMAILKFLHNFLISKL